MSIINNSNALAGKKNNDVLISTPFFYNLLDHSFSATNTDIDLAIILHKICNTNGFIRHSCTHHIHNEMKRYFISPRSHAQVYDSMAKFEKNNLISVTTHDDGKQTFQLNYFQDEFEKLYRYVALDPIVFTELFNKELSLAARKLFLLTVIQQGENSVIKRNLYGENGIYRILCKNQPNHIQSVIYELTGQNSLTLRFLSTAKLKKKKGRYEYIYVSVHPTFKAIIKQGEEYRQPISPKVTYPRKVAFIEKVLNELGIGELVNEISLMVQLMKNLGFRVIRQVIRQVREFVDLYGHFPKELATFIKKEIRIHREKEILDLANEYDIYTHIAPGLTGEARNRRYFDFALAFSIYSTKTIRRMFKASQELIKQVHNNSVQLDLGDYVHQNKLHEFKAIWGMRKYALHNQVDPVVYESIESKAALLFKDRVKPLDEAITWIFEELSNWIAGNPIPVEQQYGTYGNVENLILHYVTY